MLHPIADRDARRRFNQEAQVCARIRHPNIIEVFDSGTTTNGLSYLVMELLQGESLRSVIAGGRGLPWAEVRPLMVQLCAGLDAAHSHGVVHRDLKPDNCFCVDDPSRPTRRLKLLDFGLAAPIDRAPERRPVPTPGDREIADTRSRAAVGTPHYMSPEQCMGSAVDQRSDIYAAGIMLCELLTGVVPFRQRTPSAVLLAQIYEPPPTLGELMGIAVDPRLEAVFARAVAKDPRERFGSARGLADALEEI